MAPLICSSLSLMSFSILASFQNPLCLSSCNRTMSLTETEVGVLPYWLEWCASLSSRRYSCLHWFQKWLITLFRCRARLLRLVGSISNSLPLMSWFIGAVSYWLSIVRVSVALQVVCGNIWEGTRVEDGFHLSNSCEKLIVWNLAWPTLFPSIFLGGFDQPLKNSTPPKGLLQVTQNWC